MTIIEAPPRTGSSVFEGRQRTVAATLLVLGPIVMLLANVCSAWAHSKAPSGAEDVGVAIAAPGLYFLGLGFDLLTPPVMLAWAVVLLLALRTWARRTTWTGFIAMVLQLCGLAAVTGMELGAATFARSGLDPTRIAHVMSDGITASSAGKVLAILFFPTEIIGFIALGIALWRTGWAPRTVAVLFIASPFIDFVASWSPVGGVGFFVAFLAVSAVLAAGIVRHGAPRPAIAEHTD